ncbi:MAG: hypothetical protein ACRKFN_12755 [Desulfitobacterium sp.]
MFRLDHFKFLSILVCIGLVFITKPAYGYLDPGTGSYILQTIAAAIVAIPFALKIYWKRIRDIFSKK